MTLWSENAAAGTTHPAHNNDYYCNPRVPLMNPSGNGHTADLYPGAGLFAAVAGPLFAGI